MSRFRSQVRKVSWSLRLANVLILNCHGIDRSVPAVCIVKFIRFRLEMCIILSESERTSSEGKVFISFGFGILDHSRLFHFAGRLRRPCVYSVQWIVQIIPFLTDQYMKGSFDSFKECTSRTKNTAVHE